MHHNHDQIYHECGMTPVLCLLVTLAIKWEVCRLYNWLYFLMQAEHDLCRSLKNYLGRCFVYPAAVKTTHKSQYFNCTDANYIEANHSFPCQTIYICMQTTWSGKKVYRKAYSLLKTFQVFFFFFYGFREVYIHKCSVKCSTRMRGLCLYTLKTAGLKN